MSAPARVRADNQQCETLRYAIRWPSFVASVRSACDELSISLADVARETGIDRSTLSHLGRRNRSPSASVMLILCAHLGIDPMRFVGPAAEAAEISDPLTLPDIRRALNAMEQRIAALEEA